MLPACPPCVSLARAHNDYAFGRPFRLRLVYQGANHANVSGHSDKWWEVEYHPGKVSTTATVRWGATGHRGQSQETDPKAALRRADEKLRKGYRVRATEEGELARERVMPARERLTLQQLAERCTWRPTAFGDLLLHAGQQGMVRCDLPEPAVLHSGPQHAIVVTYVDQVGSLWGVCQWAPDAYTYAMLRSAA